MASWKVDIGQGSQAYGQSLLTQVASKRRKREKKAKRIKYAVMGLGIGDMVMQRNAKQKLKGIEDSNMLAKAVAVANYKQASQFYENQIKAMITEGINVDDVRIGGDVHQYFRELNMDSIKKNQMLTSTVTNEEPAVAQQIRERATLESLSNLKNYTKKYSKYGRYIPEGELVTEAEITSPYDRIIIDATRRLASPENTSVIRKILSRFDIGKTAEDTLFPITLDGESIKVSKETSEAFQARIQMNTDDQATVDELIKTTAVKYGDVLDEFTLRRNLSVDIDVMADKRTHFVPAATADRWLLDVEAMGVTASDYDSLGFIKEINVPLELNTANIVSSITNKEILKSLAVTDKNGDPLSKGQLENVFKNLTQEEMSYFRTSFYVDLRDLYVTEFQRIESSGARGHPIVDITPEMIAEATAKTIQENFVFTPEEGDKRAFNVPMRVKDVYTQAFNVRSDAEVLLRQLPKEEQQAVIDKKAQDIATPATDQDNAILKAELPELLNILRDDIEAGKSKADIDEMTSAIKRLRPEDLDSWYEVLENTSPPLIEEADVTATKKNLEKQMEEMEIESIKAKGPEIKEVKVKAKKRRPRAETKKERTVRTKEEGTERTEKEAKVIESISLLAQRIPELVTPSMAKRVKRLEKAIESGSYGGVSSLIKKHTGTAYRKLSMEERKDAVQEIIDEILEGE